jgi:hypothetical protein
LVRIGELIGELNAAREQLAEILEGRAEEELSETPNILLAALQGKGN